MECVRCRNSPGAQSACTNSSFLFSTLDDRQRYRGLLWHTLLLSARRPECKDMIGASWITMDYISVGLQVDNTGHAGMFRIRAARRRETIRGTLKPRMLACQGFFAFHLHFGDSLGVGLEPQGCRAPQVDARHVPRPTRKIDRPEVGTGVGRPFKRYRSRHVDYVS